MDAYLGEIRAVAFSYAPREWALCNGQLLPIQQYSALFSLLGVNYGGDGRTTFGLPNLQSRFPVHAGHYQPGLSGIQVGEMGGSAAVTLGSQDLPPHNHRPQGMAANGSANSPAGAVWAQGHVGRATDKLYATTGSPVSMDAEIVGPTGAGRAHNNLPPYLVVNYIIALNGAFPPRA
jgi:microcystin-dependent protein